MKKWFIWLLCGVLAISLTACGGDKDPSADGSATGNAQRKIGLGSIHTLTMKDTSNAMLKATAAAVVLDKNGRIADCKLDEIAFTVTLKDGVAQQVADLTSKMEKGDSYIPTAEEMGGEGAGTASWEDQVENFCDFAEGKMAGDLSGLATTDGKSDKIEGCNLIVTDFIQAVVRACEEAKPASMEAGNDLELALTAAKEEGSSAEPKFDIEMAAVTLDEGERITGCMTDTLQAKLTMAEGIFSTVSGGMETKRQMGDGYGMKAASAIKREWYEQADAFDTFAVGKTAAELAAAKLNAEGKTDAITGCTIAVSGMLKNVVKAARQD
ncbi:MAG: hypothetical protein IJO76_01580 [Clostridia bacterium]|nr:hypothetical protein [Clostridia bacterium]